MIRNKVAKGKIHQHMRVLPGVVIMAFLCAILVSNLSETIVWVSNYSASTEQTDQEKDLVKSSAEKEKEGEEKEGEKEADEFFHQYHSDITLASLISECAKHHQFYLTPHYTTPVPEAPVTPPEPA